MQPQPIRRRQGALREGAAALRHRQLRRGDRRVSARPTASSRTRTCSTTSRRPTSACSTTRSRSFGSSAIWPRRRRTPSSAPSSRIACASCATCRRASRSPPFPSTSTPRSLDGAGHRQEAETPAVFKLPAGVYTIELSQPGWEPESHDVAVEIGQPYFYQYRLKRSTAQVSIFTRPRGARVFIDERLVGRDAVRRYARCRQAQAAARASRLPVASRGSDRAGRRADPARGDADAADPQRPHRAGHRRHGLWRRGWSALGRIRARRLELRQLGSRASGLHVVVAAPASAPAFSARSSPRATASRSATARS